MITLLAAVALAATPNPDRPSVSRSAWLVAPGTLELELGSQWANSVTTPTTLKYGGGFIEPRLSADLSGFEGKAPGLEAGLKGRLLADDDWAVTLYGGSRVPVSAGEPWGAQLHGLFTLSLLNGLGLQINSGVDLASPAGGGLVIDKIPLVGLLSFTAGRLNVFGELAAGISKRPDFLLDGGVGVLLTEIVVVDAGLGWDLSTGQPIVQVGLTTNLGSPNP